MKAQMIMFDCLISIIITCVCLFAFFSTIFIVIKNSNEDYKQFQMQKRAFQASEALISTSGYPREWNPENVKTLGLAEYSENQVKHHQLSVDKIEHLKLMSNEKIKQGLRLEDHEIGLKIKTQNGKELFNMGLKNGFKIKRIALCGDEKCVLELTIK